jgi:hypothetical protein
MKSMSYHDLLELKQQMDEETMAIEKQHAATLSKYWHLKNRLTQVNSLIQKFEMQMEKERLDLTLPTKMAYAKRRGK